MCRKARIPQGSLDLKWQGDPQGAAQGWASGGTRPVKQRWGVAGSEAALSDPVLINCEGLGASLSAREGSRADIYFPLFPFKDNFIKSLCFHSGLNMGCLNREVIISPRLLTEKGQAGKRGRPW